jgi:hypothetical protein
VLTDDDFRADLDFASGPKAEILHEKEKAPEFASRTPAQIHVVSAFFTPSSSLQLTSKPFDNMSNTGE